MANSKRHKNRLYLQVVLEENHSRRSQSPQSTIPMLKAASSPFLPFLVWFNSNLQKNDKFVISTKNNGMGKKYIWGFSVKMKNNNSTNTKMASQN